MVRSHGFGLGLGHCDSLAYLGAGTGTALCAGRWGLRSDHRVPLRDGIGTPTSIMVGTGRAAEMGVLFRKGDALQLLADVDVIAFDKTGTLTRGAPVLTDLDVADGLERHAALQVMASVEQGSDHPIARAIVAAANEDGLDLLSIQGGQTYAGLGLSAHVSGEEVILGTERFMQERGINVTGYHASAKALAG